MDNSVVSNLFGIAGAIIWSIQLVPQIHLNYKRKSADNLSPLCFLSWYICGVFLGTYLVFERETVSLIIQIALFSFFCLILLFQIMHYQRKKPLMSLASIFAIAVVLTVVVVGFLYLAMGHMNRRRVSIFACIISTTLMALGFIPQLYTIYRSKSAIGISKIFICLDTLGGIFSILSLVFRLPFDYLAFITYIVVPIFQAIMLAMVLYYERNAKKYENFKDHVIEMSEASSSNNNADSHKDDEEVGEHNENQALNPAPHDNTFSDPSLYKPLSTSNDRDELGEMSKPSMVTNLIRSSYIVSQQNQTQEFDHICPESESESDNDLSTLKQNIILNQTSSLLAIRN